MRTSESINELAAAMAVAQGQMSGAAKTAKNPHLRNTYADLAAVLAAAREPLTTAGLSVVQGVAVDGHTVTVTTRLMHTSGQWLESSLAMPWSSGRGTNEAQAIGSATTYARRYSLMAMLGLAPEDDDGQAATQVHQHHPSWEAGKGRFFAALGQLGLDYEEVVRMCRDHKRPRPSAMPEPQRRKLLDWLRARQEAADEAG